MFGLFPTAASGFFVRPKSAAKTTAITTNVFGHVAVDRAKIERFGSLMRQNITTGDVPFRKAYLRSLIDAVEADDRVIHIHGSKSTLEQAVIPTSQSGKNGVRSFVRKWRSLGERLFQAISVA
jgi:site-specific DNA recombinase